MEALHTTQKTIIQENVIKNLLSAQKQIAESGDAKSLILLSKFLFHIADKRGNVVVDVVPKDNK